MPPKPSKYLLRDSTITGTEIDPACVSDRLRPTFSGMLVDPVALNHILATPSSILSPTMGPSVGPGEWLNRLVDDLNANHCATRQTSLTFIR